MRTIRASEGVMPSETGKSEADQAVDRPVNKVEVIATARYVPERSAPERGMYYFSYRVRIRNVGQIGCRLLKRHWVITDAMGRIEEVRGPGVVGEQPFLRPLDVFEYSSACPLRTPMGSMSGSYEMISETGECFEAMIPTFTLADRLAIN